MKCRAHRKLSVVLKEQVSGARKLLNFRKWVSKHGISSSERELKSVPNVEASDLF